MTIAYARAGAVALLTLNRPGRLNAVLPTMLDTLGAALDRAVAEGARALLLTGAGRGFCAGADLIDGAGAPDDLGQLLDAHYNPLVRKIAALPVPLVVAVNGPAVGAGCSLALLGDLVVAARSAYFQFGFVNIGLVPDAGATWLAAHGAGRARAMELLLLGEAVAADKAESWGLIHRVVDDAALATEARALADRLANGPTVAYGLVRRAVNAAFDADFDTMLDRERDHQRIAGQSADARRAIAAFAARNPVRFDGA
jgi:2-(1,2-epoxy-1,2-dihydrophenyl)acetyl-CoA isomerase